MKYIEEYHLQKTILCFPHIMAIEQEISERQKGGVEASSTRSVSHSNSLVIVIYNDHIEFRNSSHKLYFDPIIREAVGWLLLETDEHIMLLYDRSVDLIPNEAPESGLIIVKSAIVELREIK